ncbi:MAG: non-ribosomal peptide synthetase [Alphaproteobacteria bacterium]|nr:non-ribosomal peptide synthetase [Alphaproteobacteria bacterium]
MANDVLTNPPVKPMVEAGAHRLWLDLPRQPCDLNGPVERAYRPFDRRQIERPIFELFGDTVARQPDHVAIDDGGGQLTYRQVYDGASRLARILVRLGGERRPVGVLLPNDASYPVAVLACLAAGLPCVVLDSYYPASRNAAIIADAGLSALIVTSEEILPVPTGVARVSVSEADDITRAAAPPDGVAWGPTDPAFIVYTSGSTGQPKGIALAQRTFVHRSAQLIDALHLNSQDRMMPLGSPCTVAGLLQMFEALLAGATLIKTDLQRVSLGQVLDSIARKRATTLLATPALLRGLCRLDGAMRKLASLRCVHAAGDVLLNVDIEGFRPFVSDECRFLVTYGATEAPAMCHWFVTADAADEGARVPVGYPLPDYRYALLDDSGAPAAAGEPGELVISSRYTAVGEWHSGRLVPGRFTIDPNDPEWRILHTGDLVRCRADGLMTVLGRKDRLVKIRGMRVEPYEVECALRRPPEIADATIVTRNDGENTALVGFVVPRPGAPAGIVERLRAELRHALPPYMQPARLHAIETLPLLPGHKIDIEQLYAIDDTRFAPAPPGEAAPAGLLADVAAAWETVLDRGSCVADLPFDAAGGDSLSLLIMISELEKRLDAKLPLVSFSLAMRPSEIAALIAREQQPAQETAAPRLSAMLLKPGAKSPAVFLVHGLGGHVGELSELARHLACDHPIYALQLPGLSGEEPTLTRIEEMARLFAPAILAAAPDGPCLLVGYSLGGLIAFELARQLRSAGRDTRLLLLDSHLHPRYWPLDAWLSHMMSRLGAQCRQFVRHSAAELPAYTRHLLDSLSDHVRVRRGLRPARVPSWLTEVPALQRIRTGMIAAKARYAPSPYPGTIAFVQPEIRQIGAPTDPIAAWRGRVSGMRVTQVPGDHLSMIMDHAAITAAHLDGWVASNQAGSQAGIAAAK